MLLHALISFSQIAVFKASQVLWAAFFFIWKEGSGALRLQVGPTVGHESCILLRLTLAGDKAGSVWRDTPGYAANGKEGEAGGWGPL